MISNNPNWEKLSANRLDDGCKQESCEEVQVPEIQRLMTILEKEIERLKNRVMDLGVKIAPVLLPEMPKNIEDDRKSSATVVGESLQQKIDSVQYIDSIVADLIIRIAL